MTQVQISNLSLRQIVIISALALTVFALCGTLIYVGLNLMPLEYVLVIHAIGAPIIAAIISWIYFKRFNYTTPIQTAVFFVTVVIFLDFFVVALMIEQSIMMFASLLGTWVPYALIFLATYLTGYYITTRQTHISSKKTSST